jgi:imidazolonepropionase-like amidohydrolase
MLGSPGILELRDAVARGRVRGPTIVTSGPILDGPNTAWTDNVTRITTVEDAERAVAAQQGEGYDFVKIYSRLSPDAYHAVIAAARRRGLQVAGHVPVLVPIADVLASRQSSIEHLLGYLDAIEADTSPVRGRQGWEPRMQAFAYVDASKIAPIARATRDAGVWNCPTLVAMRNWVPAEQASALMSRDEMRYVPFALREHWLPWKGFRLETFGPSEFALADRARQVYRALVGAFASAGADLLVGTDTPSPFVLPGFSVVDELQNLVEAGLTPYQALEAATSAPARYFNQQARFGQVTVGARADLLLIDGNPLEDVARVKRPAGVAVRGVWYTRQQLDALLDR